MKYFGLRRNTPIFKTLAKSCLWVGILVGINHQTYGQFDKVMTYNIRYDNVGDSLDQWSHRKQELVRLIDHYAPDVFGIQEGLVHQLHDLDAQLPQYARIGVGRDDGLEKGEFSAIYYNKQELKLLKASTFWLSQTPDTVSVGWDASMERICTYGLFEVKSTQKKLWVFNTHYDHIGQLARVQSSALILQTIAQVNQAAYPVILMGDFNATPDSSPISPLLEEFGDPADQLPKGIYGPMGTFTGFIPNTIADQRIDYIFVKQLKVATYRHIDDRRKNNRYISDHLPVLIELN